jgi:peptide-methionine (S)-S-oxide reductase
MTTQYLLLPLGVGAVFRKMAAFSLALLIGSTVSAQAPVTPTAKAIFAGGCFWCVEADFDKVAGVISTTSGYTGGRTVKPTYEQVSGDLTGHAEAVEVVYNPAVVSYERLVAHFWRTIDPTVKNEQFCDVGTPYRTAIYPKDEAELKIVKDSRAALEKTKPFKAAIVTEIVSATAFYPAEDYHQDYYLKNPVRYKFYRSNCGRDARLKQLWGERAGF